MNADEALARAVQDWKAKHHVRDDDPMLATLDLVQIYLRFAPRVTLEEPVRLPTFEEFRETIELLDERSRSFVNQSQDLLGAIRSLSQRLRQVIASALLLVALLGAAVGFQLCWLAIK